VTDRAGNVVTDQAQCVVPHDRVTCVALVERPRRADRERGCRVNDCAPADPQTNAPLNTAGLPDFRAELKAFSSTTGR
jgi:hypothetical protein